jgi:hypothetical protein
MQFAESGQTPEVPVGLYPQAARHRAARDLCWRSDRILDYLGFGERNLCLGLLKRCFGGITDLLRLSQHSGKLFLHSYDQAVFTSSRPSSCFIWSRMRNFWIFPVTVIGNPSTNLI